MPSQGSQERADAAKSALARRKPLADLGEEYANVIVQCPPRRRPGTTPNNLKRNVCDKPNMVTLKLRGFVSLRRALQMRQE